MSAYTRVTTGKGIDVRIFYVLALLGLNFLLTSLPLYASERSSIDSDLAIALHQELSASGNPLTNQFSYEPLAPNLEAIKEALTPYVGLKFSRLPEDGEILANMAKTLTHLRRMKLAPVSAVVRYKVGLEKLKQAAPTIDFQAKWLELTLRADFHGEFYEDLYHALAQPKVMALAQFPDETDQHLNGTLANKVDYLIILLASIKHKADNRQLTPKIRAASSAAVNFPTAGNSESWFYEKKYKLYRIWEKLPELTLHDKAALLSNFLHGGRHCSVAKRWQIDDSYRLLHPEDQRRLDQELFGAQPSLTVQIESVLASEKHKVLTSEIHKAIAREKTRAQQERLNGQEFVRFGAEEYVRESATFVDASWDRYSKNFGLPARDCLYPDYALELSPESVFGSGGGYTAKRILETVEREIGDKLLEDLLGVVQYVVKDPAAFIMAYLAEQGFILSPESSLAEAKLVPKGIDSLALQAHARPMASEQLSEGSGRDSVEQNFAAVRNSALGISEAVRLAALKERQYFILVDRSASMMAPSDPLGDGSRQNWTRWDTARLATERITALALQLNPEKPVFVSLWSGDHRRGSLESDFREIGHVSEVNEFFSSSPSPRGSTPLADALQEVYDERLEELLHADNPVLVIVLTDGEPNDRSEVDKFFEKVISKHSLHEPERSRLATFSFVQIGDDHGAINYLRYLDDRIDVVNVCDERTLFGSGPDASLGLILETVFGD